MVSSAYLDAALAAATGAELCRSCVITDPGQPDNPIVYVTPEFEIQTGYAAAEVVGRNCRFLQGPGGDRHAAEKIRAALDARRPIRIEIVNYRKDGSPFLNLLSIRPVFGPDGELKSFVGVQRVLEAAPKGLVSRFTPRKPDIAAQRRVSSLP